MLGSQHPELGKIKVHQMAGLPLKGTQEVFGNTGLNMLIYCVQLSLSCVTSTCAPHVRRKPKRALRRVCASGGISKMMRHSKP